MVSKSEDPMQGIRRAKAIVAGLKDGPSPVDELIAERRAEAEREQALIPTTRAPAGAITP